MKIQEYGECEVVVEQGPGIAGRFLSFGFQLIQNRRKRLIYTSFRLFPEEFDAVRGKVLGGPGSRRGEREVQRMNRQLSQQRRSIESHIAALEARGSGYSVEEIVFRYRADHGGLGLLHYMDVQIERRRQAERYGMEAALRHTRASLAAFIGLRAVRLADVNARFVREYEDFLLRRGVSHNTICYYMRNLKSVWRQAVDDGCVPAGVHPFEHVRSKPRKTVKRALDRLSLRRIHDAEFPANSRLEFARDLFLFSFFSRGMPFVDIIYLKKSSVGNGVISYRRRKTGQWLHVSLTPQLKALIRKYANESEYVFPVLQGTDGRDLHRQYRLALERVNRYLKRIALECGVSVPLTTYVARHSWATLARESGAPVAVISEGLGHTSEKTTQIYLKEFDRRIVDRVNAVVSKL